MAAKSQATPRDDEANLPVPAEGKGGSVALFDSDLMSEMEQDAGLGGSQSAEDNLVPFIYVLQDNSPQVKKRDEKYIEGAEAGDFYLRGTGKIVKGSEGMELINAAFEKYVQAWVPRDQGGGPRDRYPEMPRDAIKRPHPENPDRTIFKTADGQFDLVDTRVHYVLFDGRPYVFPFTSSFIQVSKTWMTLMNGQLMPNNRPYPTMAFKWRCVTKYVTRNNKSWFVPDFSLIGPVTKDEYQMAKALYEAFTKKELKLAEEQVQESVQGDNIPF